MLSVELKENDFSVSNMRRNWLRVWSASRSVDVAYFTGLQYTCVI